jgi:hypothetical protein
VILGVFVTLAALTLSPEARQPSPAPAKLLHRVHAPRQGAQLGADQVYSLHARRRFAAYLRLRLLELREAGLERAADVIERRLPVDALVPKHELVPKH